MGQQPNSEITEADQPRTELQTPCRPKLAAEHQAWDPHLAG